MASWAPPLSGGTGKMRDASVSVMDGLTDKEQANTLRTLVDLASNLVPGAGPAKMGLAAGAGILRRGGDPALAMVHQTPVGARLIEWLKVGKLPRELYSPSFAINRGPNLDGELPQTFGGLTLVARPDVLDPARAGRSGGAKIWNRDAYTPRANEWQGTFDHDTRDLVKDLRANPTSEVWDSGDKTYLIRQTLRKGATRRLADRVGAESQRDFRGGEGGGAIMGTSAQHEYMIRSSPTMRSFAEFEASPRGAKLLDSNSSPEKYGIQATNDFIRSVYELEDLGVESAKTLRRIPDFENYVLARGARLPDVGGSDRHLLELAVRAYKKELANAPSTYAEMKVPGSTRFDGSNFAGAVIDPEILKNDPVEIRNALRSILTARGIPLVERPVNDMWPTIQQMTETALRRPSHGR